jgi:long-chain acyl-CoA synthetase
MTAGVNAARSIVRGTVGVEAMAGRTVMNIFDEAVTKFSDKSLYMYREPGAADGVWSHMSFAQAGKRVEALGEGMLDLGIKKGDHVGILANSRVEWALSDYAALGTGAVVVPVYPSNAAPEVLHVLKDAGVRSVIVEDADQLAKVMAIKDQLPSLEHIITMGDDLSGGATHTLAGLEARGAQLVGRGDWKQAATRVGADDVATIIYTSGTTGAPKGSVITHGNYASVTDSLAGVDELFRSDDRAMLFLPMAHTFGRQVNFLGSATGLEVAFSTPATILDDLTQIKPTMLPSVPRVWEKVHAGILGKIAGSKAFESWYANFGLRVGARRAALVEAGEHVPTKLQLQHLLAKPFYNKIAAQTGGRLRVAVSGGAKLSDEVHQFMRSVDRPVFDAYGLTEVPGVSFNLPSGYRVGSVGKLLAGTEATIGEGDELLVRGPQVFKGYYNNPKATAEAIDADGWFHTGDQARVDKDGYVWITGRIKDLIATAGGKKIAPQNIETDLKAQQFISQAVVYGEGKPYLTGLVTLDEKSLFKWAAAHGKPQDMKVLVNDPDVHAIVDGAVTKVNSQVGPVEQLKRVRIAPVDLTQEAGQLTPTLKIKRPVINEQFRDAFDSMYDKDAPVVAGISDPATVAA